MKDPQHSSRESKKLRDRAEKRLDSETPEADRPHSPARMERILHELRVHQIELEMQNEELRDSRAQVETALERYTDLYDFAPVGYLTLSVDGAIREVNLPGARLLGSERSRVVGSSLRAFMSPEARLTFDSWLKAIFTTQTRSACVVALSKKEGQLLIIVEMTATLSLNGEEARTAIMDITSRIALEEQLRHAQKMEVVGQLAGGVAHDFNNILAAMILNLEILQIQHPLPEEAHPPLRDLESLAKRASTLTRQLLLFSRQQAMQAESVEINAALAHLLRMLERLLGEEITCHRIPTTEKLWVEADVTMLDQAVMNLCLNARDAMPNGGTITLETSVAVFDVETAKVQDEARAGTFVCLRITDTGCGMNEDVLKHMFEPFFTTKELGKGTGLGLASAHGIVHQHGGWINVESFSGLGATFRIYLPLSAKEKRTIEKIPTVSRPHSKNETILVVEDEQALRAVCIEALILFGYRVLPAEDGQEALKIWKEHQKDIDLMLTDMRMPKGISGLELAEMFCKDKPSLKIIVMSGYSMEIMKKSTANNLGYTFLGKPFDLGTLATTLRHCLDARAS